MENKEIIYSLVEKHFSFSKEGLEKFKNYLFNPFIDDVYKKIVKDNLKARYPIDNFDASKFDEGWQFFKNVFNSFIIKFKINYSNFYTNKMLVDRNERKLVKFLNEYYLTMIPPKQAAEELGFHLGHCADDFIKTELKKYIENKMNFIGANKISKGKLELVFTMDFSDWFLCSTGEKWTSCINLESDYDGNYWSGLPGLVGDRNRAMLYITDGVQKNYLGIKVDRLLARSWALLNNKDTIQIVRFYPNSLIKVSEIDNIVGTKFDYDDGGYGSGRQFQSKYPVDVIKFENGCSAGVFQDSFGLCSDGYLRFGHHGYNHFDANGKLTENRIFSWSGGLKGLIEQGKNLGSVIEKTLYCSCCDIDIPPEDHVFTDPDGEYFCEECFYEHYFYCHDCGEIRHIDNGIEASNNNLYCYDCYSTHYFTCPICEKETSHGHHSFVDDKGNEICESCYFKFAVCSSCKKQIGEDVKNRVKTKSGNIYCLTCAKEKEIKLHNKRE